MKPKTKYRKYRLPDIEEDGLERLDFNPEYTAPLSDDERVRVRILRRRRGKSKKLEVDTFTIGYERLIDGKWYAFVRHCNFHHGADEKKFHTHNAVRLDPFKTRRGEMALGRRKTPTSQANWAVKDINNRYRHYRRISNKIKIDD
ncbi:MAG TPA: hypothetical protein VJ327_00495 [Patescibacteria group bacterium]|nr:hypothetical protein [Patescibacteria group bacterium]